MLELKNVYAKYKKENVLEDISLSFEKGKLTSVIGVNGCGKSTLLKTLIGILPKAGGKILIDGVDRDAMTQKDIAKKIAYLPQEKSAPDMTVLQLVLHGRFPYLSYPRIYGKKDREIALKAIERVGLSAHASEPLRTLSGGMRRNAYIAMALTQDTDYILLDEPTTYLDIAHQLELMKTLRSLADSDKGVITVMHDLPLSFDFSDKIAVINDKKIAIEAEPHALRDSREIYDIFGVSLTQSNENGNYAYDYNGYNRR